MIQKLKIAYFIDSMNSIAGTEKHLIHLINKLDRSRFEVHLFCLKKPSADFSAGQVNAAYHEIGILRLTSLATVRKIIAVAWLLRRLKIDIVQTFFIDANIIGILCAKLAGIRVIVSSRRDLGFWHTRKLLSLFKVLNRSCKSFYVNSEAVKKFIMVKEGISEDKIKVIYNGIDIETYADAKKDGHESGTRCFGDRGFAIGSPDSSAGSQEESACIPDRDLIVGITANFSRKVKRIDVFIKAAQHLLKHEPNVTFVIVGGGYLLNELITLAHELGVAEKIIFTGIRKDIPQIISQWDVAALSSDSEGLSNSIVEYMASGLPVVATNVGGNGELVENEVNGLLVPPDQPELFADAILKLLRDPVMRKTMGVRNREKVMQMFSWGNAIQQTEDYYSNLMAGCR